MNIRKIFYLIRDKVLFVFPSDKYLYLPENIWKYLNVTMVTIDEITNNEIQDIPETVKNLKSILYEMRNIMEYSNYVGTCKTINDTIRIVSLIKSKRLSELQHVNQKIKLNEIKGNEAPPMIYDVSKKIEITISLLDVILDLLNEFNKYDSKFFIEKYKKRIKS